MLLNQRPPAELGYEDGHWKRPGPPLLVAADLMKRMVGTGVALVVMLKEETPYQPDMGRNRSVCCQETIGQAIACATARINVSREIFP